jgi:hypothetical protein
VRNPISRVTIASLADLGYQVNLAAADAYTPPSTGSVRTSTGGSGGSAFRMAEVMTTTNLFGQLPRRTESTPAQTPTQKAVDTLQRTLDALHTSLGQTTNNLMPWLRPMGRGMRISR